MRASHRIAIATLVIGIPLAVHAEEALRIIKSSVVVADSVNDANPMALPGATVDYSLVVNNPNGLVVGSPFRFVVISDTIPPDTVLRTADYAGPGSGPIEFADGSLLGTGLANSGLTMNFKGLADDGDSVEFWDGASWSYHPAAGYDARVRAVRVMLNGAQAPATSFRLRFRVKVK